MVVGQRNRLSSNESERKPQKQHFTRPVLSTLVIESLVQDSGSCVSCKKRPSTVAVTRLDSGHPKKRKTSDTIRSRSHMPSRSDTTSILAQPGRKSARTTRGTRHRIRK